MPAAKEDLADIRDYYLEEVTPADWAARLAQGMERGEVAAVRRATQTECPLGASRASWRTGSQVSGAVAAVTAGSGA